MSGILTISLDVELFWGVQHRLSSPDPYRENLVGVHELVPRLLDLFQEYQIRATWAFVGLLYAHSVEEARGYFPDPLPRCPDAKSCYDFFARNKIQDGDPCLFAPKLIDQVRASSGQEVACHGFSHLPFTAVALTHDDLCRDVDAALRIAADHGDQPNSFVFPRNACRLDEHAALLSRFGFLACRHFGNPQGLNPMSERLHRLVDSVFDVGGDELPLVSTLRTADHPLKIPATRFLRPIVRSQSINRLRLRRIRKGMEQAAIEDRLYHLWWHPHNFGKDINGNLDFLKRVLDEYSRMKETHGMQSQSMGDLAEAGQSTCRDAARPSHSPQPSPPKTRL